MEEPNPYVFCLVPRDVGADVLRRLREHFAGDPTVDVIVERREEGESVEERVRRVTVAAEPAERRAPVVPRNILDGLPPDLAAHAPRLRVVQRMAPVRPGLEDLRLEEILVRVLAGDEDAPTELYWRSYERVRRRLSLNPDAGEVDVALRAVFGRVFDELTGYDPAHQPFSTWLDVIVDRWVAERA